MQQLPSWNPLPLLVCLLLLASGSCKINPMEKMKRYHYEESSSRTRDSLTTSKNNSSCSTSETFVIDAFIPHQRSCPKSQASLEEPPGHNWFSRFVERHSNDLDSRYLDCLILDRHQVSSVASFDLTAGEKIEQYGKLPENTYNMDEKGFPLGRTTKAKRVFFER